MTIRSTWYRDDEPGALALHRRPTSAVTTLLVATSVAFVVQLVCNWGFGISLAPIFGLWAPAIVQDPLAHLHTFVTYLFLHSTEMPPFHLAFNLLSLWMFGTAVEASLGRKRFYTLFFAAGIFAGICQFAFDVTVGTSLPCIGNSGAALALLVAFALLHPDATVVFFIFPMPARWLALGFVALDLFAAFGSLFGGQPTSTGNLAHLGGAFAGLVGIRGSGAIERVGAGVRRVRRERAVRDAAESRRRVDELLDKIQRVGIGGLTESERRYLREASRDYAPEGRARDVRVP